MKHLIRILNKKVFISLMNSSSVILPLFILDIHMEIQKLHAVLNDLGLMHINELIKNIFERNKQNLSTLLRN